MFQPKTGESCTCKRGVERDNCPNCEGTGQRIDFRAIREKSKVYTRETWKELIEAMNSGRKFECDEEVFNYFLEVLPPACMGYAWAGMEGHEGHKMKTDFGFAEGYDYITFFWRGGTYENPRFFGQRSNIMNPNA